MRPYLFSLVCERGWQLRELTRHRCNFIRERVNLVNRLQKTLESANIKLACVATDVMGKSGRAILEALIEGATDTVAMAELSKGRLREKRELLARFLSLDPDGAGGPAKEYWTCWGVATTG